MERFEYSESPLARAREREREEWEEEIKRLAGELAWKAPALAAGRVLPVIRAG